MTGHQMADTDSRRTAAGSELGKMNGSRWTQVWLKGDSGGQYVDNRVKSGEKDKIKRGRKVYQFYTTKVLLEFISTE